MNWQDIVNEFLVLLSCYVLSLYTEIVWEEELRYNIGWFHIGVIGAILVFNFSLMLSIGCISPLGLRCKRASIRRASRQAIIKDKKRKFEELKKEAAIAVAGFFSVENDAMAKREAEPTAIAQQQSNEND